LYTSNLCHNTKPIQILSLIDMTGKNINDRMFHQKTATKTSNKFKIVLRIGTLLVLALQNFAQVVCFSSLNKRHFRYIRSSSWVELRLTRILFMVPSVYIYFNNKKYKVQDYDFYVMITDGHVTIFQIRLQTLMKLVGQAKYLSI
jgi:hypothetical protein